MLRFTALILLSLVTGASLYGGQVLQERLNYKIILPDNSSATCKFAGHELKDFLEKTYSTPLKLNGETGPVTFFVGISSEAVMHGFTDLPDMSGKFGVFHKKRGILFHGFDDKDVNPEESFYDYAGTLLSVYYFLNKYTGTAFYFPGEAGYSITKEKEIAFKEISDIPEPSYTIRGFSLMTKEFSQKELNVFSRRMLCCIPAWGHQNYYYIFMNNWKKRFWDTHSEYFMLRDGKRVSEKYPLHIPCLTNPDVIRQTAADVIEEINKKPNIKTVRLFCDAPIYQCQCEKCTKSPERKLAGVDVNSGEEFYGFQKKVADIVHEAYPEIYFLTQTKGTSYCNPPEIINLGKSFTVQILANRHSTNKASWKDAIELAVKWKKAGTRTFLMSYPRYADNYTKDLPVIIPKYTCEYLRAFKGITEGATRSELHFNPYSFSALNQFVQARALFDLNADVDKLIAEFCAFAYPGAEKEMISFYNEMEKLYMSGEGAKHNLYLDAYYPANLEKVMKLLDTASQKVKKNSLWFKKLYDDFRGFYEKALKEKNNADKLREKADISLKPPMIKNAEELLKSMKPDQWKSFFSADFMSDSPGEVEKSSASIACDGKNLCIGLLAFEAKPEGIKSKCTVNNQGNIWGDDCFEIMLVPNPADSFYYQIAINSRGIYRVVFREKNKKELKDLPDFKIETKAEMLKDRWILAVTIPLSQFKSADFKRQWQLDIFRNRTADKTQLSGISYLGGSFHDTETYPKLFWPDGLAL
ncbi:MAG: hypothetical protein A2017_09865 [Lentisphaerae bacterium GWF2_44_16]|nr:MAG: hypothetical protein A2017_09865 [Lentisphaerae bacterium GWF2_44_16]